MNIFNYGFSFNEIVIENDRFTKKAKNQIGNKKINNEIKFYNEIIDKNINFSIPNVIQSQNGILTLEYIRDSQTLTNIINATNLGYYIDIIMKQLHSIHSYKISVDKYTINRDICIEIQDKILNRYNEYDWITTLDHHNIRSVNGYVFKDIFYYVEKIKSKLLALINLDNNNNNNNNEYNLIHGDTHLGNILLKNEVIYFIDPRGYFGETELYGLKEYDYAKLLFGISGYSIFDNMVIDKLDISEVGNITIDFIKDYEYIFDNEYFDEKTKLFALSIWLGNNSCFIYENKKIISLMIAYYYCEKYC